MLEPEIGTREFSMPEQKEGIKLTRNAKGQYQWEIKILSLDTMQIKRTDSELREAFSGELSGK